MPRSDTSGFEKFRTVLVKKRSELPFFEERYMKDLAKAFLVRVIMETPVGKAPDFERLDEYAINKYWKDYVGGTLRMGWTCQTEEEARARARTGFTPDIQGAVNRLKVYKSGNTRQVVVKNCVHYATYVENGHDQEVGRFVGAICRPLVRKHINGQYFVRKVQMSINAIPPQNLAARLTRWLAEIGLIR